LFLFAISLYACRNPQPQLPANKNTETDSTQIEMTTVNKKLIYYEDSILAVYVSRLPQIFNKNNTGFWYRIVDSTNNKSPKANEECSINYSVYTLDNEEIYSQNAIVTIGKKQIITGIEEMLKIMRRGETAEFILPWYLAYGQRGDRQNIEPYQSLKIKLMIND
ncbi:MAG: FKBP-type peptidyl-prolyl cis-trans isomerase, partial [Paludibacter sp.]|nr:FKBP-type peptidyl-prolyl cis-trans isomerase [Paludibacter sp.]